MDLENLSREVGLQNGIAERRIAEVNGERLLTLEGERAGLAARRVRRHRPAMALEDITWASAEALASSLAGMDDPGPIAFGD